MSETKAATLRSVEETLPITLYIWAMESQPPDALLVYEQSACVMEPTSVRTGAKRQALY